MCQISISLWPREQMLKNLSKEHKVSKIRKAKANDNNNNDNHNNFFLFKSYLQSIPPLEKKKKKLIHSKTLFTIPVDLESS